MCALNNSTMLAKPVVRLETSASKTGNDASLMQVPSATCEVVSLASMHRIGVAPGATIEARHARDRIDEHFEHLRVVAIRTGGRERQRNASSVHNDAALAAEFASIRRVWR